MPKSIDNVNDRGDRDPADVLDAVHSVAHLVRSRQFQALRGQEDELTPLESRVLFFFVRHPGGCLRELAEHSGRDKGQLARLVGGLRERGWLQAEVDATDKRITRFQPTEQARQRQQAMQRLRRRLGEEAVKSLSAAERQQLLALLARLRESLEQED